MIENTTDDVATALFRFGGARGHIETSRISTGIRFNIGYDIVGSTGTLRYSYERIIENRGDSRRFRARRIMQKPAKES